MTSLSLYTCTTLYIIFLTPFLFLPLLIHLLPFLSLSLSLSQSLPISLYLLLSYIPNKIDPRLSIMIRDFLQRRKESEGGKGKDIVMMEQPELSLAPSFSTNFNYVTGDNNLKFKGKQQLQMYNHGSETTTHEDLELQLCDPLPLDWEQCLDLKSGRMYYVNRKTLKKTWTRPKDLDLNLDLNISAYPDSDDNGGYTSPNPYPNRQHSWSGSHGSSGDSDSDGMVAVVCVNCHLLVMLSKASPYCPNCKFLHSPNIETVKSLETLSLLH